MASAKSATDFSGPGRLHRISDVDTAKMMDMDFAILKHWDLGNPDPGNHSADTAETQIYSHTGRPRIVPIVLSAPSLLVIPLSLVSNCTLL